MTGTLPRLIAITDPSRWPDTHTVEVWRTLAQGAQPGTVAVQLRAPRVSVRRALELGAALQQIAAANEQWLIVNDRMDLALLLDAAAIHLGEGSVATDDARALVGSRPVFRACHSVRAVTGLGANALLLSPIVEPRKGAPALGLSAIAEAASALERASESTALYALGGVTIEAAGACLSAGAHGVAAIAGVFAAEHPEGWLSTLAIAR